MIFQSYTYEVDETTSVLMRLSQATATAVGAETGEPTLAFHLKVNSGRSEFGIVPRGLNLSRSVGSEEDSATKNAFVPVATQDALDTFNIGDELAVGGTTWTIAGKRNQELN